MKDKNIRVDPKIYAKLKKFAKSTHRNMKSAFTFICETNPHFGFLNNITPAKAKEFNKFNPKEAVK